MLRPALVYKSVIFVDKKIMEDFFNYEKRENCEKVELSVLGSDLPFRLSVEPCSILKISCSIVINSLVSSNRRFV